MTDMINKMNIRVAINSEVTKAFTAMCKERGFKPTTVIKYLIENRGILDNFCENIFDNVDAYIEASKYFIKVSKLPENNGTPYKLTDVDSDVSLKDILRSHGISVVFFFCYLVVNQDVFNIMCDSIPGEYKMKKCQ